jgi:hypothetical protein
LIRREPFIAKAYGLLKAIMNTAVDDGLIRRNPCRIKGAARTVRVQRTLTHVSGGGHAFGPPKSAAGRRTVAFPD